MTDVAAVAGRAANVFDAGGARAIPRRRHNVAEVREAAGTHAVSEGDREAEEDEEGVANHWN